MLKSDDINHQDCINAGDSCGDTSICVEDTNSCINEICCSTTPLDSSLITNYYNSNKKQYYQGELRDELDLYVDYFGGINSKFCDADFTVNFEYTNYFNNDNIGGFIAPNSTMNPLDYTKSYRFIIRDMVESYDEIDPPDMGTVGGQDTTDWWQTLGFDYNDDEWIADCIGLIIFAIIALELTYFIVFRTKWNFMKRYLFNIFYVFGYLTPLLLS